MTGHMTDPPFEMPAAYYLGICDTCQHVQQFLSVEDRDHWETTHHYQED